MNSIKAAVVAVGGVACAARLCGVSSRAINKWVAAARLPRTEFTGETRHAENLAKGAKGKFTADSLKAASAAAYQKSIHDSDCKESWTMSSAPEGPVNPSSKKTFSFP
ncbi:hypothetical protein [Pseudomonas sp. CK-NBRI-02]|uniref:hypothetical protein n=1 Tax=Pseudomonas sp. CK-NBRI-02 TaxID=2249759 RepID=UPI0019309906|nr:hypothetical protein [Pseudomonas sp. CK-NBRI-02]